ncbi:dihydrolipoamide dehydrogenase [Subsaxibacter sp. CAU 1640]|uniref:dihydrolipoamide dehydrogenase n=1 Tax=Subsaxibacter sp. CAU 1640 TaxID=2933271 RepID=UPI0020040387|nr:dihydrolipoamide dehydrogenase [Subsaxibacter sp. CAU 1640]MCK7590576.1 dihydrolipoamide dehydrogenase [Subsaxibacter sp. CAU 1640]
MKNVLKLAFLLLLFTACEGDPGPPGADGITIVGQSFERTVNFTEANGYEQYIQIPLNIELFPTDMILTYILWEQDPVTGNDVWRLIPQTVYTDAGEEFMYNYDYSFDEVRLFIDAPVSFDFNNLSTAATLNQTFRMVVLPVDFINSSTLDISNYNDVMQYVPQE